MSIEQWTYKKSKELSRTNLYNFLNAQFGAISKNARVLTIGAGGEVNERLDEYGARNSFFITSCDIDPDKKPDLLGDICYYILPEQYDVIVMSEVLEHVENPHAAISNIYRSLKPGGRLILSTPFILPIHDAPYDYFRYTRHGLEMLLRSFTDIRITERNSYYEAIDVLWARLRITGGPRGFKLSLWLIPLIYYVKRPLTRFLSRHFPADSMTTGYVVSALKPV